MFKLKHRKQQTVETPGVERMVSTPDPADHDQQLRNDLGRILGVDPETLHPDKGRRADA